MTIDAANPETYPRRILVAATGMSPQIVTETLYALAVTRAPAFVPSDVTLITTRQGAALAAKELLDADTGWFHRLRSDYRLPAIKFDAERIHVLTDASGAPLDDLRTPADNTAAADAITQLLCDLTRDASSALHVSIAGGRKTMGFYLGYALSLYGRRQDRLSHVLVTPPYESLREFFYPTPKSSPIKTARHGLVDAKDGEVALAEIPLVRLREGMPRDLQEGKIRFHDAVDAAQRAIGPPELVIDLDSRRIRAGGRVVALPPVQLAFLAWLARRQQKKLAWLQSPVNEREYASDLLREYDAIVGPMGARDRTAGRLQDGMEGDFFSQTKTRLHGRLKDALGERDAAAYLVSRRTQAQRRYYGLDILPTAIHFRSVRP